MTTPPILLPLLEEDELRNTGMQSLIEAAEASTELPNVSTPSKTDQGHTPIDVEATSSFLDIAQSPVKKKPPWKDRTLPTTHSDESAEKAKPFWFADTLGEGQFLSATQKCMLEVERKLCLRFPKSLPMNTHLLEFLAQTTSPIVLEPSMHQNEFMMNGFVTALPLVWCANIIYSKRLVTSVAAIRFPYPSQRKKYPF
jgi:hypothetical protein